MSDDSSADLHLDVMQMDPDDVAAVEVGGQATMLVQIHTHDDGMEHVQVLLGGGLEADDMDDLLGGLLAVLQRPDVAVQRETANIINSATEELDK